MIISAPFSPIIMQAAQVFAEALPLFVGIVVVREADVVPDKDVAAVGRRFLEPAPVPGREMVVLYFHGGRLARKAEAEKRRRGRTA